MPPKKPRHGNRDLGGARILTLIVVPRSVRPPRGDDVSKALLAYGRWLYAEK